MIMVLYSGYSCLDWLFEYSARIFYVVSLPPIFVRNSSGYVLKLLEINKRSSLS